MASPPRSKHHNSREHHKKVEMLVNALVPLTLVVLFFQSGLGGSERMSQLDQRDACHTWRRKEKVDLSRSAVTSSLGIAGQSKEARYCVVVSFLVVSSVLF